MKLIKPYYNIIEQSPGLIGVYKQIELAARTAYKSENKITDKSAIKMVNALINNKHFSCLEHGTIYLDIPLWGEYLLPTVLDKYSHTPYSAIHFDPNCNHAYITTNARVLVENNWVDDIQYLCEPTEFHERRVTVKFMTSIGVGREILRHRRFSFLNESTRYCNYSKKKFDGELTFIIPTWVSDITKDDMLEIVSSTNRSMFTWYCHLTQVEDDYLYLTSDLTNDTLTAEQARGILPLDLKSELVVTGFVKDWIHFFELRSHIASTGRPHPDLQLLADQLLAEFLDKNYIQNEDFKKEISDKSEESSS